MDFELNTPKEIWEAKKTLYESDSATKKSFISSIVTLVNKYLIEMFNLIVSIYFFILFDILNNYKGFTCFAIINECIRKSR